MRKLHPLRALQAFEAAARLGSFKAAAAERHVMGAEVALAQHIRRADIEAFASRMGTVDGKASP
jgi:DNA-binding transcriptional LysR family regulator